MQNEDGSMIEPNCLFNYEETNLTDNPGVKKCIFRKGVKYPERVHDSTKSSISVLLCGAADGKVLPPYVVYKTEHLWGGGQKLASKAFAATDQSQDGLIALHLLIGSIV